MRKFPESTTYRVSVINLVVAAVCQVWFLFGTQASGADPNSLNKLLTASAVCDLLVSGVSMLRMLLDGSDAVRACYRNAKKLSTAHTTLPDVPLAAICLLPSPVEIFEAGAILPENEKAILAPADDDQLWDLGEDTGDALDDDDNIGDHEINVTSEGLVLFEHGPQTADMLRDFDMSPKDLRTLSQ